MCSTADLSFVDFGLTYELADVVLSYLIAAPQRLRPGSQHIAGRTTLDHKVSDSSHSVATFKEFAAPPLRSLVAGDSRWASSIRQVQKSIRPKVCSLPVVSTCRAPMECCCSIACTARPPANRVASSLMRRRDLGAMTRPGASAC